jgi:hypothetical protein
MIYTNTCKKDLWQKLIISFILTFLVFSFFIGQLIFFPHFTTFARREDALRLTYPSFLKLYNILFSSQTLAGPDLGTFNGATEFFLRPNLPVLYPPLYLFMGTMKICSNFFWAPRGFFLLFYISHMFFCIFYAQKLVISFFNFNKKSSVIFSCAIIYLLCFENWYISMYIVSALVPVCFYYSLKAITNFSLINFLKCTLCFILAFTSGYFPLSFALCIAVFIFTLFYFYGEKVKKDFKPLFHYILSPVCAGLICLPYAYQVFIYIKKITVPIMTFPDSIFYKFDLADFLNLLSTYVIIPNSKIEQTGLLSVGFIACTIIFFFFIFQENTKLSDRYSFFSKASFLSYFLILLWAAGDSTPVAEWFYTFIPVIGTMHLQLRFLMVLLPFVYISIGLFYQNLDFYSQKNISILNIFSTVSIGLLISTLFLSKFGIHLNNLCISAFVLESILLLLFLFSIRHKGKYAHSTAIIWCFSILFPACNYLYLYNQVNMQIPEIKKFSIVYNMDIINSIDNYLSANIPDKKIYRFVAYDTKENVPNYLVSNLEWYKLLKHNISNYSGYELHESTPQIYTQKNRWFNIYDWQYITNTRADFIMTDAETISSNPELFNTIIDYNKEIRPIGNGRYIYTLKKFVPKQISGMENKTDSPDSFDNGYFYSADLTANDVTSFSTNENSLYKISYIANKDTQIAFLPYPNRFYHYFFDGKEISPDIDNMEAFIKTPAGAHVIEIRYINKRGGIAISAVLGGFIILLLLTLFFSCFEQVKTNKNK